MATDAMNLVAAGFQAYFDTPRLALLDLLTTDGGSGPEHILELGCGCGANLAELRRRFPRCTTTGVELNTRAAAVARSRPGIDRLMQGDALDPKIDFETGSFDVVVLSHVLEHFVHPEAVLARCRGWLQPGGVALIALPNIRNALVLKELVFRGDFRYQEDGILDRTHLRFYTRTSAVRMIEAQGFRVKEARADVTGKKFRAMNALSLGLASEFAAFAFNFLASKS